MTFKSFFENDGVRCPNENIHVYNNTNDSNDQYRHLKLFFGEYVGEFILSPLISYPDMEIFYPIQFSDLRFEVDQISP